MDGCLSTGTCGWATPEVPGSGQAERVPHDPDQRARAAVLELARGEHRRHHPALVHVGEPSGRAVVLPADHGPDHALRADVLGALLWHRRDERPLVWLTRAGSLSWQDVDADWYAGWRAAGAEVGVASRFLVVTRHGWHDPTSGATRTWRRIRDRRRPR